MVSVQGTFNERYQLRNGPLIRVRDDLRRERVVIQVNDGGDR